MAKVPDDSVYIVPEDDETSGHATTYNSACYADQLAGNTLRPGAGYE